MAKPFQPHDAMRLLFDPEQIRFACNPFENAAWKHASQASVGKDGLLPATAFAERDAVDAWARRLTDILEHGANPEELALKLVAIPKHDPWDLDAPPESRTIALRGILGRCLSNHLAAVLEASVEPLLPDCAIAYRPNRSDAVQAAILKVAHAVGVDGRRFYAKLDVKDCFNSMPREAVALALADFGLPNRFIELVMLSVGARRYRRVQGAWVEQNSEKGCPAGLPESSTLVNVLFNAFDRWVRSHCPDLVYYRYCDDFLFVGSSRAQVERAVGELVRCTKALGLKLKGVSPTQSPHSLVHDARERPLRFLGAAIAADGDVHIPHDVVESTRRKIRYRMHHAALAGALVAGQSRYALPGARTRGILTFDADDVLATVVEFHRYWFGLNQGEATAFLGRARTEFDIEPRTGRGPYRKLWVAALGDADNLVGGGMHADQDETSHPLERWVRQEVLPLIRDVQQGVSDEIPWELHDELSTIGLGGTSDPSDKGMLTHLVDARGQSPLGEDISSPRAREDEALGFATDDLDVNAKELNGSAIGALGFNRASRGPAPSRETSGATTLGPPVPPGRPSDSTTRLVFVRHTYNHETDETVVRTDEFSMEGRPLGTFQMAYRDQQPTIAVLDHLLRRAAQSGGARLVFAMEKSWLAKALLRRGLELRSVAMMQRIQKLHAVAPTALVIAPVRFSAKDKADDGAMMSSGVQLVGVEGP